MNTSFNLINHVKNYCTMAPAVRPASTESDVDKIEISAGSEKEPLLVPDRVPGIGKNLIRYGTATLAGIACGAAITAGGVPAVIAATSMVLGFSLASSNGNPYAIATDSALPAIIATGASASLIKCASFLLGGGLIAGAVAGGMIAAASLKAVDWSGKNAEGGRSMLNPPVDGGNFVERY